MDFGIGEYVQIAFVPMQIGILGQAVDQKNEQAQHQDVSTRSQ